MFEPGGRSPAVPGRIVLGLTLLAGALRFYHLTAQSLWVDEAATVKYATIFGSYSLRQLLYDLHGPAYAVALHGWTQLFGTGEAVLRSFSALLGTLTVPALYWAIRPLRRPRAALLACALLAVHPYHVWYSQEVRNYVLFMLVGLLSTGLFVRLLRADEETALRRAADASAGPVDDPVGGPAGGPGGDPEASGPHRRASERGGAGRDLGTRFGDLGRRRRTWLYGAVNTLGLLSHLSHLFTLLAHGWTQLLRGRRGRRLWVGLIVSWAVTLALLSPWSYRFWEARLQESGALEARPVAAEERIRGETTSSLWGVPYSFWVFSVGYSLGPSLRELHGLNQGIDPGRLRQHLPVLAFSALVFGTAAALGAIRLWRDGPVGRTWLWVLLVPLVFTYLVSVRNIKVFNPRYATAAFPAYVLAVAEGVGSLRRRHAWLLGLAILVPTGASLAQHYHDPAYAKDDARSATRYLRAAMKPGDLLFVVGTDEPLHRYYWRGLRENPDGIRKEDDGYWQDVGFPERFERFERARREQDETYVLFLRDHWVDPGEEWRRYLGREHPPVEVVRYPGVEIWRLPAEGGRPSVEPGGGER